MMATARLAAALTRIENSPEAAFAELRDTDIARGRLSVITGAPGAGKSSLIRRLIEAYRQRGERVGAILIDPSSSISGGSLLGDRLRMLADYGDDVFIRSVAAGSGAEGIGLVAPLMAWRLIEGGYDHVFLESVGIGQQELDVAHRGDTLVLVLGPDSGDWVQFTKSGILEMCDAVAVTKADLDGGRLVAEIRRSVNLQSFRKNKLPVYAVSSASGEGIGDLVEEIDRLQDLSAEARTDRRASIARDIFSRLVLQRTEARLAEILEAHGGRWQDFADLAERFLTAVPTAEDLLTERAAPDSGAETIRGDS